MRRLLAMVVVLCLSAAIADEKKPAPPPKKDEAPQLSELARQLLRRRMERHGRDLNQLASAVVLLKRDVVAANAQAIVSEPRIVRPLPDARDELNSALPERFFVLQDELRERAKALADTTRAADDKALAESYGRMITTCVACHALFLPRE
jgi:cytochrome c553